jgi:alkyl hydroperoxide reductase subunit AhpC
VLGVGEKFPSFSLTACVSSDQGSAFRTITHQDFAGSWIVYFFWAKDFTEVARSEIIEFAKLAPEFSELHAQMLAGSVESELACLAWREQDAALRHVPFPTLADTRRELCGQLGILDESEGVAQPSCFIVDPEGVIRFVYVTDLNVTPDPGEVLRVLADLQDVHPA